mgnify:CR=1 FL=1
MVPKNTAVASIDAFSALQQILSTVDATTGQGLGVSAAGLWRLLAGGTAITITGTNFLNGTTVTIGGVACLTIIIVSDTTITCITPAGTAGAKNVAVIGPDLATATAIGAFTYQAPIVIGICAVGDGKYTDAAKLVRAIGISVNRREPTNVLRALESGLIDSDPSLYARLEAALSAIRSAWERR